MESTSILKYDSQSHLLVPRLRVQNRFATRELKIYTPEADLYMQEFSVVTLGVH